MQTAQGHVGDFPAVLMDSAGSYLRFVAEIIR